MTLHEQIKSFYTALGQNDDEALQTFRHYFPNDYDLNEVTHDMASDFISHNPSFNHALLIGVNIGKSVATAVRPKLLSAKFSEEIGYYAQRQLGYLPQEQLCLALLDAQLNVIGWETLFVGSLTNVQASPREIFQSVLRANALGFMIIHNHPSGNLMPSDSDIRFSQRLKLLGEQMEIPLFDSFIVTRDSYWSLSENNQLKSIK